MTAFLPILFSLLSLILGRDEADIVFAGDAMMHQRQLDMAERSDGSYDFSEYFRSIAPYIASADYAVVNLETAVSKPPYSGYPCFNAPESYVRALADAGFDLILTANNHTLDRRHSGLISTLEALDSRGLDHIGTYRSAAERDSVMPFVKTINGIRIGFLNYTYGTNGFTPGHGVVVDYIDKVQIEHDVRQVRDAGAEAIVVCIHWGDENRLIPNNAQKELAAFLRSLDVDVIIGGHPHVVQPVEMTLREDSRPQLLFYSLGNFISNMLRRDNRGGMLARVRFTRDDDGKVVVMHSDYRLVYTNLPDGSHNYRLTWADESADPQAKDFLDAARNLFNECNIGVAEEQDYTVAD